MATSASPAPTASAPQPASSGRPNAPAAPRSAPRAAPSDTKVKQLAFAFPFLKKGQRESDAAVKFTDEHEIYQLLADREPGGSFLVSKGGFWHGGIHVTEGGAGSKLDLKQGIRCIADGRVIAYRLNRTYPVSQLGTVQAPYSTGFALVRHTMEFPKGKSLTFYSLYMHLQAYDEYERDTTKAKPAYWSTQRKVAEYAQDKPDPSRTGQAPEASQQGLKVRSGPKGGHRGANALGILPQGASVSIGEQHNGWGRITDANGAQAYAPKVGDAPPATVVGGWIFLGSEHGGPVVRETMPDDALDRVVITLSSGGASDPNAQGIPVKAGDLMGHLGRYDSLSASPPSATRMAHIEVFCDESVKSFIEQSREWVGSHGAHPDDWKPLGVSSEPTLLRIAAGTKLYRNAEQEGAAPPVTGAVQRWALAELARDPNKRHTEATADRTGRKLNWWRVGSADQRGQAIEGWVREENHAGGQVTREFAQKWIDFECIDGAHDPAHTMFATTKAWVDYVNHASVPDGNAESNLSPVMKAVYRKLFPQGDGNRAADELCQSYAGESGHYPWLMQAASRLIVKHESEWANPQKWRQLYTEIENGVTDPRYEEEQKRIEKLVWWDEVKAKVPGFPGPDVFHIHPVGLAGNFAISCDCAAKFKAISSIILRHEGGYVNNPNDRGGPTKYGITLVTWEAYAQSDLGIEPTLDNLKNMTTDQAETIYLNRYWEPKGFCRFDDMRIALMVYDWTITSGGAAKQVQNLLNNKYDAKISADGAMGQQTVQAINAINDQDALLNEIANLRKQYYTNITVKNHSQLVFLRGWHNRVDDCLNVGR